MYLLLEHKNEKIVFLEKRVLMDEDFFIFVHVCIKEVKHYTLMSPYRKVKYFKGRLLFHFGPDAPKRDVF